MAEQNPRGYTVDEALVAIGHGKFQIYVFLYAMLGSLGEAMELMLLTYVGLVVEADFQLTSSEENLISIVTYVGIILGAWIWSAVSDSFGRKPGFLGSTILTSLAGLISCFAPNYITLLILRFIVGLGLGGAHVFTTWFMEFVPTLERGTLMIAFFLFTSIGTSGEALLAWGVVERYGWRLLLGLSSLPSLFALSFYRKVPESPRFLYAKGELGEARRVLDWGAKLNNRQLPGGGLISAHIVQPSITTPSASEEGDQNEREVVVTPEEDEIKDDVSLDIDNTVVAGEIQQMDDRADEIQQMDDQADEIQQMDDQAGPEVEQGHPENENEDDTNEQTKLITRHNNNTRITQLGQHLEQLLILVQLRLAALKTSTVETKSKSAELVSPEWRKTTLLLLILFFLNTYSYSGIIHLTSELKSGNPTDPRFYKDVFIISLAELPGLFLVYLMMEIITIGRKRSMTLLLSLGFIMFAIQALDPLTITKTTVFVTRMLMSGSFAVMQIYSEEVYPTHLRTLGVGVAISVGRIGSIILPLVGEWISDDAHKTPVMIMFLITIGVCGVCALFLPFETRGKGLEE